MVPIRSLIQRFGPEHAVCREDYARRMSLGRILERRRRDKLAYRVRCCARSSNPHGGHPCNVRWCCLLCDGVEALHWRRVVQLSIENISRAVSDARWFLMTIATPPLKNGSRQLRILRRVVHRIRRAGRGVLACVAGMAVVVEPARAANPRLWRIHLHVVLFAEGWRISAWNADVRRWNRRRDRQPQSTRRRTRRREAVSGLTMAAAVARLLAEECRKQQIPSSALRTRSPLVHCKPLAIHRAGVASTTFAGADLESASLHAGRIIGYATNRLKESARRMRDKDWVDLRLMKVGRVVALCGAFRMAAPTKSQIAVRMASEIAEAELAREATKPVSTICSRHVPQGRRRRS